MPDSKNNAAKKDGASDKSAEKNKEQTQFGRKRVKAGEKAAHVEGVFSSVAENYDIMNDVMSGGIHRIWKDRFVRMIAPTAGQNILDVAGGTGDIAFRMLKRAGSQAHVTVCDINADMLRVGEARAIDKGIVKGIDWVHGNAEDLPFDENSFDTLTIAFGLRNVPKIDDALESFFKVLKPGGRFYCLEFSHLPSKPLQKLYDGYSKAFIPKFGELIAKDRESYEYLIESIRAFPKQDELKSRIKTAGFTGVKYRNLSFGIAAIHSGIKPEK